MRRFLCLLAVSFLMAGCPDKKDAKPDPAASAKPSDTAKGGAAAPKASASSDGVGW